MHLNLALQNAASIATLLLTTESMAVEKREEEEKVPCGTTRDAADVNHTR